MEYTIRTNNEDEMINITHIVKEYVTKNNILNDVLIVYVPHTTAGVTINESYDPDVVTDMLLTFRRLVPKDPNYLHLEGNSHSHVKASMVGSSILVIVENGQLKLGTWQGIFFCEFDGPRRRTFYLKSINK